EAHNVFHAGAVVPAAIENHDLAGGGKEFHVALDEHLALLPIGRRVEGDGSKHAWTDFFGNGLNRASLAGGVAPFEQHDHPQPLCLYPSLQMAKLNLKLAQFLLIGFALHLSIVVCHRYFARFAPQIFSLMSEWI